MKKLNRKGFTLIELLAVIVILAVVMVVTIPSVINAMKSAKQNAYEESLEIIERYVNNEYEMCKYGLEESDYTSEIFNHDCSLNSGNKNELSAKILSATGYEDEISYIEFFNLSSQITKYTIKNAYVQENGKFSGVEERRTIELINPDSEAVEFSP